MSNMSKGRALIENEDVVPSAPPCYEDACGGFSPPYNTNQYQAAMPPVVPHYPQQTYYAEHPGAGPIIAPAPVHQQPHPAINVMLPVGPKPLKCECPSCHAQIKTRICSRNRYAAHACCLVLFLTVICACFSCLPYCMCPKERTEHFCPKCNAYLGSYLKK